jgi:polysaccharide biosynthesis/export protein
MMYYRIVAAAALGGLTLSSCASNGGGKLGASGQVQVLSSQALPEPGRADAAALARPYQIGAYDELIIDVFGIEELSKREVAADSAGRVSFPIAGTIDASGMTPQELADELTRRLRAGFIRNPQVSVNLMKSNSQFVTVDGQVTMPGVYPVTGGMTLQRAVASARGVAEFAALDDVVVLRQVGGQRYAGLYNLAAIRRGNYPDPPVYANDTVVVGESRSRRMFKDLLQVIPLLTTPIIVALQN